MKSRIEEIRNEFVDVAIDGIEGVTDVLAEGELEEIREVLSDEFDKAAEAIEQSIRSGR